MPLTRIALLAGLLATALVAGGCRDDAPLQPPTAAPALRESAGREPANPAGPDSSMGSTVDSLVHQGGLLRCSPQPYDSVTRVIGPEGGTIEVGENSLVVPAGALAAPTAITAVAPSDTVDLVRFQPQGLVFRTPASLTMSYENCDLHGVGLARRIAYVGDSLEIVQSLASSDDEHTDATTTRLQHFSGYAVAW